MAPASSTTDPSQFAVSVAVGYGHVLDKILGFLERTSAAELNPVLAVSLVLPVLLAYLVVVAVAFTVRVAADSYSQIIIAHSSSAPTALLWQEWVVKIAVYVIILSCFGVVCSASLQFSVEFAGSD